MKDDLEKIINYIVNQGLAAIKEKTDETNAIIDYLAIFSKNQDEFKNLELVAKQLGEQVFKENDKTGPTFLLHKPFKTEAGSLKLLKIRLPDMTRPQRGAPDFKIDDYREFKNKWLGSSGTFTLMPRKSYEMIEMKGTDVLVYFPDKMSDDRLKLSDS